VSRVVFVFADGIGVAGADATRNPLAAARLPTFERHLGGGRLLAADRGGHGGAALFESLRATMGVEGTPQSGTGQAALLTGRNTAAVLGRHFGPWVPTGLRDLVARENVMQRALEAGRTVAFANAYPTSGVPRGGRERMPSAFPFAARSAGLLTRTEVDLQEGRAVAASITNTSWRRYVDPAAPEIPAEEAGAVLARIAEKHDLTVFAHFDTDTVGHRQELAEGAAAMERLDAFLGGLLAQLPEDAIVLLTSDHGNLEDVTMGHTTNEVPLVGLGADAASLGSAAGCITGVAALILGCLGVPTPGRNGGSH